MCKNYRSSPGDRPGSLHGGTVHELKDRNSRLHYRDRYPRERNRFCNATVVHLANTWRLNQRFFPKEL
ncbi:hypothetical protein MTR_8g095380 [Medicago truncatula]|uniref:Uncharacterized protein n=1 Tax=Medicago truncatula TaxID=3880 RepID=G7LGH1_MEDTR|nr:hypothetical protein MTR_8g095380 [Medicago truncatula]